MLTLISNHSNSLTTKMLIFSFIASMTLFFSPSNQNNELRASLCGDEVCEPDCTSLPARRRRRREAQSFAAQEHVHIAVGPIKVRN